MKLNEKKTKSTIKKLKYLSCKIRQKIIQFLDINNKITQI